MRIFYFVIALCLIAATASVANPPAAPVPAAAAKPAEGTAPASATESKPAGETAPAAQKADKAGAANAPADTVQAEDPAEAFMKKYGKEAADSLEIRLRNDYTLCTGDESRIGRAQLFRWKAQIDSQVMHKSYTEKFNMFIKTTSMKAHEVRPCEPLIFYDQLEKQVREMDSTISAQRAAKEKAHQDSVTVAKELKENRHNPADILNVPAGVSRATLQTILARNKIKSTNTQRYLQADMVKFEGVIATIAFYFDENDRYNGYEIESEAVKAERLDGAVREWAERMAGAYEKKLGPPSSVNRVSFRDIKQGQLSITTKWDKGPSRPRVLVGIATNNHLYYAKVMVSY